MKFLEGVILLVVIFILDKIKKDFVGSWNEILLLNFFFFLFEIVVIFIEFLFLEVFYYEIFIIVLVEGNILF